MTPTDDLAPDPTADDARLDEAFGALANTTRRAILARLAEGAATVNELAEPFDLTLPAVSKHIKVLERAGLVTRSRSAQFRPCAINPERMRDVASWTEQYRAIWETRFDQMNAYLDRIDIDQDPHEASGADGADTPRPIDVSSDINDESETT